MHKITTTLLLGVGALLASNVHAGQTLETPGFTLSEPGEWHDAQMTLLSNEGGTLRIGLAGLQAEHVVMTDLGNQPGYTWDMTGTVLAAAVTPGYRITSMTLSGTLTGLLDVAALPSVCDRPDYACGLGTATNEASLEWSFFRDQSSLDYQQLEVKNLNGERHFSLTTTAELGDTFNFSVATYNTAFAEAGRYLQLSASSTNFLPTTSSIGFSDMVMTVQIAAVPEPGTYAMLLAGMGLLGVAVRRQRK